MTDHRASRRRFLAMAAGTAAAGVGVVRFVSRMSLDPAPEPAAVSTTTAVDRQVTTSAAAASSTTSPAPPPSAPTMPEPRQVICREAWGARPTTEGGVHHTPSRLTLHHTGTQLEDPSLAPSRARGHQLHHQDRGWVDLAYHFLVDPAGNVYAGRPVDLRGDTSTDYDTTGHLLVCCEGNFEADEPTDDMLAAVADVFTWAVGVFGIPPDSLACHRDLAATACPGEGLATKADLLAGMVGRRIGEGGVELVELCGPEAEARVAAIETA